MIRKQQTLFDSALLRNALVDSVKKLDPRIQWRNPVMFVVYIGSLLTTGIWLAIASGHTDGSAGFTAAVALWLWVTVLFANFAEALAEGRSKAQAEALKGVKKTSWANKLATPHHDAATQQVPADSLRKGDIVLVSAGEMIPCDGEVLEGGASVDESAITGGIRTGDPRIRRRFRLGHRRYPRTVRLAGDPMHRQPRRNLYRPHDRHGGKRQTS